MSLNRSIVILLAISATLAGCTGPTPEESTSNDTLPTTTPTATTPTVTTPTPDVDPTPQMPSLMITVTDYAIDAPATIGSGYVNVTIDNQGAELHHATFYKLDGNHTMAELREALVANYSDAPEWATPVGGPNAAVPGGRASAVIHLEPGHYAIACIIPTASDHRMHVDKGMIATMNVTESNTTSMPPAADMTIRLNDFSFGDAPNITAGRHTIRVINDGPHNHEFVVFELFGNTTTMEFLEALDDANATGPPPGRPVGGLTPMGPGREGYVTLDFTPGRYTFVCFDVAGTPHGEPHFLMGMTHEFVVT